MNQRTYVRDKQQAIVGIAEIVARISTGQAEPVVGFDLETMPGPGLTAYPTTLSGATGTNATLYHYMLWIIWTSYQYFDTQKLEDLGCPVPTKTKGKFAKPQWSAFFENVKAKRKQVEAAMLPGAELPFTYWFHALTWIGENRKPHRDPVQPGLKPADTDVFVVQYTLEDKRTGDLHSWVFNTNYAPLELLYEPLLLPDVTFVGHNIKFDLGHAMKILGPERTPRNVFCTMVADVILRLGIKSPHDLASVAGMYLGVDMDKAVRASFIGVRATEMTAEQIDYSFLDTEVLIGLYKELKRRATITKQWELVCMFGKLSWVTALWETSGYVIDSEKWLELTATTIERRDKTAAELEALLIAAADAPIEDTGVEEDEDEDDEDSAPDTREAVKLRLSQRALVAKLAQRVLGLSDDQLEKDWKSVTKDKKTGKPITTMKLSKDARSGIEFFYTALNGKTHPFFGLYATYSALAKMASTYGATFLWNVHPITERVHPTFRIAGTETARYASTNPNFLNLPRGDIGIDVREAIKAPQGYNIGGADYSAFEMRAAAALSLDPSLLKIFNNDVDMHSGAAILAFHNRRVESWHGKPGERRKITEQFRIGANLYEIEIWEFTAETTSDLMLDFALSKEGLSALLKVRKEYKDGTPKLDDDGNEQWEKPTRQIAKIVNFLIIFGGGPYTLAAKTNIPVEQAELIIASYHAAFPDLMATIEKWASAPFTTNLRKDAEGRDVGFVEGRGNLRRYFYIPAAPQRPYRNEYTLRAAIAKLTTVFKTKDGWCQQEPEQEPQPLSYEEVCDLAWEQVMEDYDERNKKYRKRISSIKRQAFNLGPQGGNAVVTAKALLDVIEAGLPYGILPFISVYDEIKLLVPVATPFEVYKRIIETAMVEAAAYYFPELPFEASADPLVPHWKKF